MTAGPVQLGWLDANLFIHPLFANDPHRPRCEHILRMLRRGEAEAWVDPVTVHELTYALPRARPDAFPNPRAVLAYLGPLLALDAVRMDDKDAVLQALYHWATHGGRFGDARILALARGRGMPVCSVNASHFPGVVNTYLTVDRGGIRQGDTP